MRVALISDIHGNLLALKNVLRALRKEGPSLIVCLGDVAASGPNPHEVLELLRTKNIPCVMGNTDEWLLKPVSETDGGSELRVIERVDRWCADQLTQADMKFLRTFKPTIEIPLGGGEKLLAFHGSPRSNREWIPSTGTTEEFKAIFSGRVSTIMAGGHSHTQMLRKNLKSTLVNPGSVGMPYVQDGITGKVSVPPWSEYAVVSYDEGSVEISFKRVPLNLVRYGRSIHRSSMPSKQHFLGAWTRHMENLLRRGLIR